jgi:hypothetical protein
MKTIFTVLSLIAIMTFSFSSFAQNFSVNPNPPTETYGQISMTEGGGTTITHSVDPNTVTGGNSILCLDTGPPLANADNGYWRSFVLTDFGITIDLFVTMVEIGIESATSGDGTGTQPLTCNLYITDGVAPFPAGFPGSLSLIGTHSMDVPDQALTLFQIPVIGSATAGSELVVEIAIPNTVGGENHLFFIGSNALGQTAPSYISSVDCGSGVPDDLADIGFPNMHIVMSVTGNEVVPVELTSFTAIVNKDGNVILNWSTATEVNNHMFEIERRNTEGQFTTIGYVEGFGTTTEQQEYSYSDNSIKTGTYFYRLKQIDFGGQYEYSDEIEVEVNGPLTFALEQNYPNPFNPSTSIKYSVPENGFVKLSVYNLVGEEVSVLVNETVDAGFYEATFNAANLPSGTYFYRLQVGTKVETKKMILLK